MLTLASCVRAWYPHPVSFCEWKVTSRGGSVSESDDNGALLFLVADYDVTPHNNDVTDDEKGSRRDKTLWWDSLSRVPGRYGYWQSLNYSNPESLLTYLFPFHGEAVSLKPAVCSLVGSELIPAKIIVEHFELQKRSR